MIRTLLGSGHPSLHGISYERLQDEGWVRLNYPKPFVPFTDGFPTSSGRLEFVSAKAERDGHGALPTYTPPFEGASTTEEHPLALIAPASHWFLNSTFANHPQLRERAGGPRIELHPDDAAARGLTTGDQARVFNDRGEFIAAVEVSDRVRPGVIASTKGHWLKHVRGGNNANATTAERDADMGRGAVFHDNRVQVESMRSSASSARLSGASIPRRSPARTTAPVSASYSSGRPASRS
jgi:anaerobic selenocysteine-containing dehydrogenase